MMLTSRSRVNPIMEKRLRNLASLTVTADCFEKMDKTKLDEVERILVDFGEIVLHKLAVQWIVNRLDEEE